MELHLVDSTDPALTNPCLTFDFQNPPFDPVDFSRDLLHSLLDHNGIGLAANQVGVPYRIFAMRGHPENFVCFNPKVVQPSEQQILLEEGCLTFPGLFVKVKRPQHLRIRWTMPNGETRSDTFTGMSARIIQHEIDHLDGIMFYSRANKFHRDQAFRKWELSKRKVA